VRLFIGPAGYAAFWPIYPTWLGVVLLLSAGWTGGYRYSLMYGATRTTRTLQLSNSPCSRGNIPPSFVTAASVYQHSSPQHVDHQA